MRRVTILGLVLIFCAILASSAEHWDPVATFSILGFDPETGEIGGAVQSRVFSVGNGVLWAEAGVGAAATQAAGGDKRGMQSAAMLIVKKNAGVWLHNDVVLRLQVDDNPEPIKELRRLVEKGAAQWARSRG